MFNLLENLSRHTPLRHQRKPLLRSVGEHERDAVRVRPESAALLRDIIGDDERKTLFATLPRSLRQDIVRLCGEPYLL